MMEARSRSMSEERMLRILCFHGFSGNAQSMQSRVESSIGKGIGSVEFRYTESDGIKDPEYHGSSRGWWAAADDGSKYYGWKDSIEKIQRVWKEDGPFDGVLGLSQGATLAAISTATLNPPPRFAIIVSGFLPRASDVQQLIKPNGKTEHIEIPTFHWIGRSDTIVSPSASRSLLACFKNPTLSEHNGGHYIPTGSEQIDALKRFLDEQR
eukprot:TRINITY_DN495_c0_g1_i1.p1 TRINITY_DN495_c0_g1~~TRINITY_DN495_c0_g1_i1.p1  ORF type:complete len:224 (-),score=45.57 TRINITY_DN495_c0_g1_i1:64-693(-)